MTLRSRIALVAAAAVAISIVAAAYVAFAVTRSGLRGEIDESLMRFAGGRGGVRFIRRGAFEERVGQLAAATVEPPDELLLVVQFITPSGDRLSVPDQTIDLPVTQQDLAVARGQAPAYLRDVNVDGDHLRMITAPAPTAIGLGPDEAGSAVQVARQLGEVDATLRGLGIVLLFVALGGVGLAGGLGLLVARSALRPVGKLTAAAETVARTQDLDAPIVVDQRDEIGRLASSFNAMLRALKESRDQQQRLVADASHELRTPLTSLRTNIEMLSRNEEMEGDERAKLLADLNLEMEALSNLVAELVDLATASEAADEEPRDVRLDEIASIVVERARRRTGQRIDFEATPGVVRARPAKLERAAANLVDNACKWNSNGEPIEVRVRGGRIDVRDHGPGIDSKDLPHVFDRFYRAPSARSMPGSGLGLAIVKQVVEGQGGRVWAEPAPGGGALVGFEIPERNLA